MYYWHRTRDSQSLAARGLSLTICEQQAKLQISADGFEVAAIRRSRNRKGCFGSQVLGNSDLTSLLLENPSLKMEIQLMITTQAQPTSPVKNSKTTIRTANCIKA